MRKTSYRVVGTIHDSRDYAIDIKPLDPEFAAACKVWREEFEKREGREAAKIRMEEDNE